MKINDTFLRKWGMIKTMENDTQTPDEAKKVFEADLLAFAMRYSLNRVHVESQNFIRDYRRSEAGDFLLVSEKAIVKAFGQSRRVPIGDGEQYKTHEEAEAGVRATLSEYYRKRRDSRSENEKRGEARRQRAYRERRKQREIRLDRQQ